LITKFQNGSCSSCECVSRQWCEIRQSVTASDAASVPALLQAIRQVCNETRPPIALETMLKARLSPGDGRITGLVARSGASRVVPSKKCTSPSRIRCSRRMRELGFQPNGLSHQAAWPRKPHATGGRAGLRLRTYQRQRRRRRSKGRKLRGRCRHQRTGMRGAALQ